MKATKKCAFCGRTFIANSGMQKYCSVHCADEAKKAKKKRQRDLLNAVEPVLEIQAGIIGMTAMMCVRDSTVF